MCRCATACSVAARTTRRTSPLPAVRRKVSSLSGVRRTTTHRIEDGLGLIPAARYALHELDVVRIQQASALVALCAVRVMTMGQFAREATSGSGSDARPMESPLSES